MDSGIIKLAQEMLDRCAVITLASIDQGYPRAVSISKIRTDGVKTIWFSTTLSSIKTNNFWENPAAGVAFFEGHNSVTLLGRVTVVVDREVTARLWQKSLTRLFKYGVADQEYVVLKFTGHRAVCRIDNLFKTVDL